MLGRESIHGSACRCQTDDTHDSSAPPSRGSKFETLFSAANRHDSGGIRAVLDKTNPDLGADQLLSLTSHYHVRGTRMLHLLILPQLRSLLTIARHLNAVLDMH